MYHSTWESLVLGVIPIVEKNVGLDRTLHKLPALLVEDFAVVTPTLLRTAYLEAIYHATDFEFDRLTQQFWHNLIFNVSTAKSSQPLLELFPYSAIDLNFTRPLVPFECGGQQELCGPGTIRTPKLSCWCYYVVLVFSLIC